MILHFMKPGADLLSSFDRSWKQFSDAWKGARSKSSEKSIHDLRVKTRRLIAVLDLAQALSGRNGIDKLRRRFKKVLKSMGPLRDLQVQLENVSQIPQGRVVADFKDGLQRRERRYIKRIPAELRRGTKHRLARDIKELMSELDHSSQVLGDSRIVRSVERVVKSRRNEFLKAERRFQRLKPANEEALHEMRIALKKMRYVVEAAQPVLDPSAKQGAREMRTFQQMMGDSRDLEMLRTELEKWARKKGKKIAVVPALERLQEKRQDLFKKISGSSEDLDKLARTDRLRPVTETTRAVAVPAATPTTFSRLVRAGHPDLRPKK
jgi:CHAD domain-containing protein